MSGKLKLLFSPLSIKNMQLKNRLAMAPIGGLCPSFEGFLNQEFADFILTRAKGGVGMIILGDAGGGFTILEKEISSIELEKKIESAKEVVKSVHKLGARIGVQLHHSGRETDVLMPGSDVVGPSSIPWSKKTPVPRELTSADIDVLIDRYVKAAINVHRAGFDFVEVKACHGYLLSSFLSTRSNQRNDQYGGNMRNRARIVTEIIRRIKGTLGPNLLISCRFNGADHIEGGMGLEEAQEFSSLAVAAGADFLHVSAGVYGSYPVIIPPYYAPVGCYVHLAESIKKCVSVPVIAVGRINDPKLGEEILKAGKADIIAMGRPLIADPDLPRKAREGRFKEIRKCIACNQGCFDRPGGIETTCLVNPEAAHEKLMTWTPVRAVKKVAVIGGGISGMEAARVAALRGHTVDLYEQEKQVGGQWNLASIPPGKANFADLTNYLFTQIQSLGVKLHLETKVTEKSAAIEDVDVIIIATGAIPITPDFGEATEAIIRAGDVLTGKIKTGKRVIVVGGNAVGLETAYFLALSDREKNIEVVEMMDTAGKELGPTVRSHIRHCLNELNVKISCLTKVQTVSQGKVMLTDKDGKESSRNADSIVIAVGCKSNNQLALKLKDTTKAFYVIGDALKPRNGLCAMRDGAEIGRII